MPGATGFASALCESHELPSYSISANASLHSTTRFSQTPKAFHSNAQVRREPIERRTLAMRTAQNQTPTGFYSSTSSGPPDATAGLPPSVKVGVCWRPRRRSLLVLFALSYAMELILASKDVIPFKHRIWSRKQPLPDDHWLFTGGSIVIAIPRSDTANFTPTDRK
jgi:hypothetical protein